MSQRDICTTTVTVAKGQKTLSVDEQNVVYLYHGILFSLKKGILTYATTWVNHEDTGYM
jgi:hypothetical protein